MIVHGITLGPVTLLVGPDDRVLDRFLCAAHDAHAAVLWDFGDTKHPHEHAAIVAGLRQFQGHTVAGTHSPYVADHFAPSEVLVVREGSARWLSEHPEAGRGLTTGELLTASGEGWWWP